MLTHSVETYQKQTQIHVQGFRKAFKNMEYPITQINRSLEVHMPSLKRDYLFDICMKIGVTCNKNNIDSR